MSTSKIFASAHKVAKATRAQFNTYRAAFSAALRKAWGEAKVSPFAPFLQAFIGTQVSIWENRIYIKELYGKSYTQIGWIDPVNRCGELTKRGFGRDMKALLEAAIGNDHSFTLGKLHATFTY